MNESVDRKKIERIKKTIKCPDYLCVNFLETFFLLPFNQYLTNT